jgi:hypothetical protein
MPLTITIPEAAARRFSGGIQSLASAMNWP